MISIFVNDFPKSLLGLMRRAFPRHRFQPVMHALISSAEYAHLTRTIPVERHGLSPDELKIAGSYTLKKRQDEWLTGRICAKMAVLQYHNATAATLSALSPSQILVSNRDTGRPYLEGVLTPELEKADLSLSHGAGYGLALVADTWCGVDIEEPRQSLLKVREKFCMVEEEELLQHYLGELSELQRLTLIWTAKEAVKKALSHERMPGFLELILSEAEPHTGGWLITFLVSSREFTRYPATVAVTAELYEGYGLALCLTGENIDA